MILWKRRGIELTRGETIELVKAARAGSEEAKEKIILGHKGMVYNLAKQFSRSRQHEFEDMFQEGLTILLEVIDKFDTESGNAFSTYAYPYVFGKMNNVRKRYNPMKISVNITYIITKIRKYKLADKSAKEIYLFLNKEYELKWVRAALEYMQRGKVLSLEKPFAEDDESEWAATLKELVSEDVNGSWELLLDIKGCIPSLTSHEQYIFHEYFLKDRMQSDIANELGVKPQTVSKHAKKALRKVKLELGGI
ncbi:RNA polymerase sigma-70 factor, sigma-B/F/G subfamily [Bacillus phage vB_BceM_Bc431v3]|uniref:RNA polymerase sigma-70 factor, sigma-B/F/G subfamily n=1 Tax=Bacillus phage vB_BceM_Bc431v3 TaxID=1195072 RepID=M4HPA8_9CAUD|nr:RNA polymerase sigma factor [Bacillus phage vB_BceM_Bc431v3]AFQ96417.1 RNA polymerase sigma-70 factor, sigma-B/F/G subfamily [Bacillus phage vB_BceM_Bc431v3]